MNKKIFKILIICLAIASLLIIIGLLVIYFAFKTTLEVFWIPSVIVVFAWMIFGLIRLIKSLSVSKESLKKIEVRAAIEKAKIKVRDDEDNGDNLIIEDCFMQHTGQSNPKTPVLVIIGLGSEKKQRRVLIINLNNSEEEISNLINPSQEEILEKVRVMAEDPEPRLVPQETINYMNQFGIPFSKTTTQVPASQKERDEKNKKDAEEKVST